MTSSSRCASASSTGRFLNCRSSGRSTPASRVDTSTRRLRSPSTDALLPVPSTSARQGTRFWPVRPSTRSDISGSVSIEQRKSDCRPADRLSMTMTGSPEISAPVSALGFSAASAVDHDITRAFWPVASAAVMCASSDLPVPGVGAENRIMGAASRTGRSTPEISAASATDSSAVDAKGNVPIRRRSLPSPSAAFSRVGAGGSGHALGMATSSAVRSSYPGASASDPSRLSAGAWVTPRSGFSRRRQGDPMTLSATSSGHDTRFHTATPFITDAV